MKLIIVASIFLSSAFAKNTKCIAHRGNNKFHLENSMEAIISAYELGADGVEFDVVHTKDGVAVVNHDKDLKRVGRSKKGKDCRLKRNIKRQTFQEIRENCELINGDEVSTLEEVMSFLQDKKILRFIEFKDTPNKNTLELIKYYNEYNAPLITIISFSNDALEVSYEAKFDSKFWMDVTIMKNYKLWPKFFHPYGINLNHMLMKSLKNQHLLKKIGVWTIDKVDRMKLAFSRNVDFLTSNDPITCLQVREELKQ